MLFPAAPAAQDARGQMARRQTAVAAGALGLHISVLPRPERAASIHSCPRPEMYSHRAPLDLGQHISRAGRGWAKLPIQGDRSESGRIVLELNG